MYAKRTRRFTRVIMIVAVMAMIASTFSSLALLPGHNAPNGFIVYGADNRNSEEYLDSELNFMKLLVKRLQTNYKDEITLGELLDGAYQGIFEALDDPYSEYYIDVEVSNQFVESVTGEFSGVGVSVENYNGLCRVVAPIANTPAELAGIKSGDIITAVDGISLEGKSLNDAVTLMKGADGSSVTLTVDRSGSVLSFTMNREKIKSQSVFSKMMDGDIGYIQITTFDNDTHLEFKSARIALLNQGAKGFVIDIRNNPGGIVGTAVDIAEQLMPAGPIMHFSQQGTIVETVSGRGNDYRTVPIVLLTNGGSASASEILAGALKDSGVATLVGTTTFGKGVAQQVATLENGASMKLSMYYFLTPNQTVIDHVGVIPHHVVQNGSDRNEEVLTAIYNNFAPMTEQTQYKSGEIGLNVYGAQQRLALMDYDVSANGTMDTNTVAAVQKFQREHGIQENGILDVATADAIHSTVIDFINGLSDGSTDKQLNKALELLQ